MLLDGFANCDTACDHGSIICHIEDKQVSLIAEHSCDLQCALLEDVAVRQVQVCQSFVVLDTLSEKTSTFHTDVIVVEEQFGQEALVLQRL